MISKEEIEKAKKQIEITIRNITIDRQEGRASIEAVVFQEAMQTLLQYISELESDNYEQNNIINNYIEIEKEHQKENGELRQENKTLKEQLQMFIPRRRVRRVYKMLGKILRTDIDPVLLEKELKSGG